MDIIIDELGGRKSSIIGHRANPTRIGTDLTTVDSRERIQL